MSRPWPARAISRQPLDGGWTLRCVRAAQGAPDAAAATAAVPATVPGCVHTDLLANGLIPDPFVGANETDLGWVAASDWGYTCRFTADADLLAHLRVDLALDGLDTLATVTLNGTLVGRTANMHRRFRFDVTGLLADGENELDVVFRSATEHADHLAATEGEWPSASFGRPFNHVRKMACSWGWDWGPWLTTAGVWRPAALVGWTAGYLGDLRPHVTIGPDEHGHVELDVDVAVAVASEGRVGGPSVRARLSSATGTLLATASADCGTAVDGHVRLSLDAGTVERWWPHSHGDQPLYTVTVELTVELADELADQGAVLDAATELIGFRTVALDTRADTSADGDGDGSAFTLVVNGRPIFARGVNWIPDDVFPSRVTGDDYRERLQQAVDANVDLVRVWGGGLYEDDRFYAICDELGLLVWQDFAFACAAYPEHLLADEVEAEAIDNVSRLMRHPSLAIWNGNNENIWGYWDWEWEAVLQGRAWGAGFYHDLLPRVCAELDPLRPYWPGSPWSGADDIHPNSDAHGCVHVWDVWNQLDLTAYRDHTPRFAAEFGWQAPPSIVTMHDAIAPADFRRDSVAMRSHQKATDGDLKLDRGIVPRFGELDDIEAFWYAAHVVQARALRTGIEHFRSLEPRCMGTIWWQLNDCWPVVSWAVVDGAGRPKPAWYALRDAYRSRLITIQPRPTAASGTLALVAVNDGDSRWTPDVVVRRLRLDGTELARQQVAVTLEARSCSTVTIEAAVATPGDPTDEVIVADAGGGAGEGVGEGAGDAWWWFAPDRDLQLRAPELAWSCHQTPAGLVADVVSRVVVRELTVYPERVRADARCDRQLVDLQPGVPTRITFSGLTTDDLAALQTRPVCWTIADLIA